jgi:hypothetical protein
MAKQDAQKMLSNVPQEFVFWCHKGGVLTNLNELRDALNSMADEDYAYHANSQKNDFSAWVKDIIKDEKLASDLSKAKTRPQAAKAVSERLTALQSRVK